MVVNLALKEEAKRKDEETRALLEAAAQQTTANQEETEVLVRKIAKELDWKEIEAAWLAGELVSIQDQVTQALTLTERAKEARDAVVRELQKERSKRKKERTAWDKERTKLVAEEEGLQASLAEAKS